METSRTSPIPAAKRTSFGYDESNRKTGQTVLANLTTHFSYDNDGNVIAVLTPGINGQSGLETDTIYDALGRKTEIFARPEHWGDEPDRHELPNDQNGL